MNTLTLNLSPVVPTEAPLHRLRHAYLTEIRMEFKRLLRTPALVLPMTILPVALYLLFAVAIAGEAVAKDPWLGVFMFGGFSVMATSMPALFSTSASLAMEREMGLMRLRRAQPAPAASWLIAKIVVGLVFCVASYLPMVIAALWIGNLPLGAGQWIAISLALMLGSIPFCALGLAVGAWVKGTAAPGIANLLYLPGCYLSGMFFPLPKSMYWQVQFWPQFHLDQLAMHAAGATKYQYIPAAFSIGMVLGFTVLFGGFAVWRLARKG